MRDTLLRHMLELLMVVPASILAFLPVRNHLRRPKLPVFLGAFLLEFTYVFGVSLLCTNYRLPTASVLLVTLLLFFPVYLWAVDLPWEKLLFCFSVAVMLCIFCSMYTNYLTAPIEQDALLTFSTPSSLVCLGLSFVVGLLFLRSLAVHLPYLLTLPGLDRFWAWLSLIPISLSILFRWLVPPDLASLLHDRTRTVALVLLPLFPLVLMLVFTMFWRISRTFSDRARLTRENELLRMESKRYDALRRYMDETRELRHDFRQHVRVIGELAAAGETERLQDYVRDLEAMQSPSPVRYCANRSVDALCAWYTHRGGESRTAFAWTMELPEKLPMPEPDFCALLGNLLDNALKAVGELPEEQRRITVAVRMLSEQILGISVENPYRGTIRLGANGLPVRRSNGRGIGLVSVANIVKRNHGTFNISTDNNVFSADILMYF